MERNNNRAGWVQTKYDRLPNAGLTATDAAPVKPVHLPELTPHPYPPVIPMPEEDCNGMGMVMAYVKKQQWGETYEPEAGLDRGTIFPELDLPFAGEGACPHNE